MSWLGRLVDRSRADAPRAQRAGALAPRTPEPTAGDDLEVVEIPADVSPEAPARTSALRVTPPPAEVRPPRLPPEVATPEMPIRSAERVVPPAAPVSERAPAVSRPVPERVSMEAPVAAPPLPRPLAAPAAVPADVPTRADATPIVPPRTAVPAEPRVERAIVEAVVREARERAAPAHERPLPPPTPAPPSPPRVAEELRPAPVPAPAPLPAPAPSLTIGRVVVEVVPPPPAARPAAPAPAAARPASPAPARASRPSSLRFGVGIT